VVGTVSRDEGDLSTGREGGDGDGGRGFSPWLGVSLRQPLISSESWAYSVDIKGLAVMSAILLLRLKTKGSLHKSQVVKVVQSTTTDTSHKHYVSVHLTRIEMYRTYLVRLSSSYCFLLTDKR